jgi:hypothetical protein
MSGGAAVEGNCALLKKLASRTGGKNRECIQRCEIVSAICEDDLMTVSMDEDLLHPFSPKSQKQTTRDI